jgi:hypothetical protein
LFFPTYAFPLSGPPVYVSGPRTSKVPVGSAFTRLVSALRVVTFRFHPVESHPLFSASRPSVPPSFPARAHPPRVLSVPAEHGCHLARMLQRQAPRVLACLATHDRARPSIPSVLSLTRVFNTAGELLATFLVPSVAQQAQASCSCSCFHPAAQ